MGAEHIRLLHHPLGPGAVRRHLAHRVVQFEHGGRTVIQNRPGGLEVVRLDPVMLLDRPDLARMDGRLADHAVGEVLEHLLVEQFGQVEVLEHRCGQYEAVGTEGGDQPRNHRSQRSAVDRHAARAAQAKQGQQVVAADAKRQDAAAHAGRLEHRAELAHFVVTEHLGRLQRRHQQVVGVPHLPEIGVEVVAGGLRDDEAGQLGGPRHGENARQDVGVTHPDEALGAAVGVHVRQHHRQVEQGPTEVAVGDRILGAEDQRAGVADPLAVGHRHQVFVIRRHIQRCPHRFSHPMHS